MKIIRYIRVATVSIGANKLRSMLTMLGLIIGIGSVVTTVGIGRGAALSVTQEFEGQGLDTVTISPRIEDMNSRGTLTSKDAQALSNSLVHPEIVAVVPSQAEFAQAVYVNRSIESQITGTTADYASVKSKSVRATGRFFTELEVKDKKRVAVLSETAAEGLFDGKNPVSKRIRINGESFEVIGVFGKSGSQDGESFLRSIYVPLSVAQTHLFKTEQYRGEYLLSEIIVKVINQEHVADAKVRIEQTLRLLHNLGLDEQNDFIVTDWASFLSIAQNISMMMTALLGGIGSVSLLVGGIGIMNIMLVSVTERTSEIGLRKALGATDGDILLQFLVETLVLCVIGGGVGIGMSYSVSMLINQYPIKEFPIAVVIEPISIALAIVVSLLSGLIFGLYPAIRATRLDPIEALRFE